MANTYDPLWLERAMRSAGIRTGQLAEASGVSRSQIQRIKRGMAPRMDTQAALNVALAKLSAGEKRRAAA
jgi:transcriptional regulator with XRE-family HTH domain